VEDLLTNGTLDCQYARVILLCKERWSEEVVVLRMIVLIMLIVSSGDWLVLFFLLLLFFFFLVTTVVSSVGMPSMDGRENIVYGL
jgi:hypothetical protein